MRSTPTATGSSGTVVAGARRSPSTWMYHSVSESQEPDPHLLRVHPDRLERQLRLLRRLGVRGVSLREALEARAQGRRERLVALTFDDGYADFRTRAMPALERHGMTATVYVVAGRLGGINDWDADAPQVALMSGDDVRAAAAAGHEIGSHGWSHLRLEGAGAAALEQETRASRTALEDLVQAPVAGFCFPYGGHDDAAVAAVEAAGYGYACVTDTYGGEGPFRVPRFYVGQRDGALRLLAKEARHRMRTRA